MAFDIDDLLLPQSMRRFRRVTVESGEDEHLGEMEIIVKVLEAMNDKRRRLTVAYLVGRYGE